MDGAVQRSLSLSPNYMIAFKPTPQSKIALGVSSVFIELRDENGVRVFKAYVEDGEVVFHKNGIEFIDVTLAHIISSPSGSFYYSTRASSYPAFRDSFKEGRQHCILCNRRLARAKK